MRTRLKPRKKKSVLKSSLSNSAETISKAMSPLVVIAGLVSGFNKILKLISEHYIISLLFLLFILVIFGYHFVSLIKKRGKRDRSSVEEKSVSETHTTTTKDKRSTISRRKILSRIGVILLVISFGFTLTIFATTINGFHYPIISSIPKNDNSRSIVDNINKDLKSRGHKDFHVTLYCRGDREYCAVVANGTNFSEEEAKRSIKRAQELIPSHVSDPWIQSFTPVETIRKRWQELMGN